LGKLHRKLSLGGLRRRLNEDTRIDSMKKKFRMGDGLN
jgi:hypothetical protein